MTIMSQSPYVFPPEQIIYRLLLCLLFVCIQLSAMEVMIGFAEVVTSAYYLRMSVMEAMNVWTEVMNLAAAELMVRRSTYVRMYAVNYTEQYLIFLS